MIRTGAWWDHVDEVAHRLADLLDARNRGVTVIRRGGQEWRGPGLEVGGHLVWGFTAALLDALFDTLGWTEPWDDGRELPLPG